MMYNLQAPLFAPRSETDGQNQMIDLHDVFSDVYTQDWQFLNDALGSLPAQSEAANSIAAAEAFLNSGNGASSKTMNTDHTNKYVTGRGKDLTEKMNEEEAVVSKRSAKKSYDDYFESYEDEDDDEKDGRNTSSRRGRVRAVSQMGGSQNKRRRGNTTSDVKALTESQRVERRERNREHAKRSRIRKKFMLESLLEQLGELRTENKTLRQIIREQVPGDEAHEILNSCSTEESLLLCAEPTNSPIGPTQQLMEPDFRLMQSLQQAQQNFVVSDPSLPDNPIVYASRGFLQLTGYTSQQCLGRNCRFLQGPGTDPAAVDVIRKGVEQGVDTSVCLLNYKADGTPFWNQFFVAALRDADGHIVNYVGVQCQANEVPIDEIKERAKHMALIDI